MKRYYAKMKKGNKVIYAECCTKDLLQEWIAENQKLGFKLIELEE